MNQLLAPECPACSVRGTCVSGSCVCQSQWTGPTCEGINHFYSSIFILFTKMKCSQERGTCYSH